MSVFSVFIYRSACITINILDVETWTRNTKWSPDAMYNHTIKGLGVTITIDMKVSQKYRIAASKRIQVFGLGEILSIKVNS